MANSHPFIEQFISIYREHPALWKIKSKSYADRRLRERAYDKLLKFYKTVDSGATVDTVKKRINNLRSCFRKELKKVKSSRKSGCSSDDIYTPSLWYYNQMLFTADQEDTRQTIANDSTDKETEDEKSDVEAEEENEGMETEDLDNLNEDNYSAASPQYISISTPSRGSSVSTGSFSSRPNTVTPQLASLQPNTLRNSSALSTSSTRKKKRRNEDMVEQAFMTLNQRDDEYDTIGVNVANKLRKMDDQQKLFAENIINNTLFYGMQKKLNDRSQINLNCNEQRQLYGFNYLGHNQMHLTHPQWSSDLQQSCTTTNPQVPNPNLNTTASSCIPANLGQAVNDNESLSEFVAFTK